MVEGQTVDGGSSQLVIVRCRNASDVRSGKGGLNNLELKYFVQ